MSHRDLLPLLLPPVSYDPSGAGISAALTADANVFDAVQASADRLVDDVTPLGGLYMLPDWERVLGITAGAGGAAARLQVVLDKLREQGGLVIKFFIQRAATLGYVIDIDEPQPFRAGTNRAGDTLYVSEIIWTWVVRIRGDGFRKVHFRAGASGAGDRLLDFGDPLIEAIFQDLKPAWTFVSFEYPDLAA